MADVGFSVAGWRKGKLLGYGRGLSDRQGLKVYVSPYAFNPCLSDYRRPYPSRAYDEATLAVSPPIGSKKQPVAICATQTAPR